MVDLKDVIGIHTMALTQTPEIFCGHWFTFVCSVDQDSKSNLHKDGVFKLLKVAVL